MPVYLDHAATTPMRPEAIAAYTEAMGVVGNPSSIHSQGQQARRMLEEARETVAASLGADPIEVVFTSGGTEAINLAIKGMFWARNDGARRPRILVPGGEHHATVDTVEWLERAEGAEISWLALDGDGLILVPERIAGDDAALLTFLAVNNEVGTIQPVSALAAVARSAGVPVHVDAVAAYGHLPIDFAELGVDALSVSAHKIGGPVGIGALVLSRASTVVPLIHGGGQQRQVRSGTQDVAAAVSFATAARLAEAEREAETARLSALRDRLITGVRAAVPEAVLSGPDPVSGERVASNAHFTFPGAQGDSLLFLLDLAGVSVSTGSACQAGIPEPSHVLLSMGRGETEARSALRFTLGRGSTDADVDALLAALPGAYAQASRAGLAERAPRLGR
ncbi:MULTISPECIES: cysteine desulfurase family protein [unclassified Leifsonia]|uniref:cysteine desulfurase family protein n=1 Tax=unclassified Leifsonia TaxID=2663824 RepID=UPI00035E7C8B|nr:MULTISPECIES: cysteine desulfurase family protein [unclassified Leifsonia]TDQ03534.1 cysteine desulfurase [Leifsonia sp. 115AMFTsu3.1]